MAPPSNRTRYFIFPSSRRNSCSAIFPRMRRWIIGKRDGLGIFARYVRQLFEISNFDAGGVPKIAENLSLPNRGRQSSGRFHHEGIAKENPRIARGPIIKRRFLPGRQQGDLSWAQRLAARWWNWLCAADVSAILQILFAVPASVACGFAGSRPE